MSLSRIPFSLSVIWAVRTMLTAPRSPASSDERVGTVGPEVYLMPFTIKTCFYIAGLAEILSILAQRYPQTMASEIITLTLNHSSSPESIALSWPFFLAWICCISGALIRQKCYQILGQSFTFEISLQKDHKLIISGPYAYVRHPSYSSGALGLFGALTCHTMPGAWLLECSGLLQPAWAGPLVASGWVVACAVFVLAIVPRLEREDNILKGRFNEQWDTWAERVPYRLIPYIF